MDHAAAGGAARAQRPTPTTLTGDWPTLHTQRAGYATTVCVHALRLYGLAYSYTRYGLSYSYTRGRAHGLPLSSVTSQLYNLIKVKSLCKICVCVVHPDESLPWWLVDGAS